MRSRTVLRLFLSGLLLWLCVLITLAGRGVDFFVLLAGGFCLACGLVALHVWLTRRLLTPLEQICGALQELVADDSAALRETDVTLKLDGANEEWRRLADLLNEGIGSARAMYMKFRDEEIKLQSLTDNIPGGVYRCLCDQGWTILHLSQGIEKLSGYPLSHFFSSENSRQLQHLILPKDEPHVRRSLAFASSFEIEYRIVRADGSIRWVRDCGRIIEDESGEVAWMDGVLLDITEERLAKETLRRMHRHDSMTGLYSRAFFDEELSRLQCGGFDPVSVIVCDVDCLKLVNDRLGHESGDTLLKTTAALVRSALRRNDFVARTGGDEIMILLPSCCPATAETVADKIRETIRAHNASCSGIPVALSLGTATGDLRDMPAAQLVSMADKRMFSDKRNHHSQSHALLSGWIRGQRGDAREEIPAEKEADERLY